MSLAKGFVFILYLIPVAADFRFVVVHCVNKLQVGVPCYCGVSNLAPVPLCKIDSEGKARKVVGCSMLVVKDYGEDTEGLHIVQEYLKSH